MDKVVDPELVIGIVGRMGVDVPTVIDQIEQTLHGLHYQTKHIKLTDFFKPTTFGFELPDEPIEDRYKAYIDACNTVRRETGLDEFFASYAIERIRSERRRQNAENDASIPLKRTAFVINQIKRPEEAAAFRNVYGQQFILVSCHMPRDELRSKFAQKISEGHANSPKTDAWLSTASDLIQTDEKETAVPNGQRVSDVFPLADLVVDVSDKSASDKLIDRFFCALFGNFTISPTKDEFFQNIAHQTSLTSCDTARQVGAAITRDADILSLGYNEAPKPFGGTYWPEDGIDGRDVALGKDANTVRKRQMVIDIVQRLNQAGELKNNNIEDTGIAEKFLDGKNAPLSKSQIMDTLEYGRAVHAEMAAIASAARLGSSLKDSVLFCTTFPCHNCAKHIVASGITKVYYLEPYSKSFADYLYPDSIVIDQAKPDADKVIFQQFVGITPNRFKYLFAKERLKDAKGNIRKWDKKNSQPIIEKLDQGHTSREIVFQKSIEKRVAEKGTRYLGK